MTGDRDDPVLGYNFTVTLTDASNALSLVVSAVGMRPVGGFSECSGLDTALDVEEYREGGNNGLVRKFATRVTWTNIKLRRGVTTNNELWKWHYDFVEGRGRRCDGVITLLDDARNPVRVWRFKRGLPVKWVGPVLNAGQGHVAVEELEIGHEGLKMLNP